MVGSEQQKEDGPMKLPIEQCPWCGGREFVVGYDLHAAGLRWKTNPAPALQTVRHGAGQQGGGYVKVSERTEGLVNKTEAHKALCASVFAMVEMGQ